MSPWLGKYIIGLTGNISTGKSVVRKMLEHLGAYGIDADTLGHRAIARGAPGYQPVVDAFGTWLLHPDGQIDRSRLARVVFSDPQALATLEEIVHPIVIQAVDMLVRHAYRDIVVIEAIKLLESDLRERCDSVWVTTASLELQLSRLMQRRGMDAATARQRVAGQPPQEAKLKAADVVISTEGTFEETWLQVKENWRKLFKLGETSPVPVTRPEAGTLVVSRGKPKQAAEIADLINRLSGRHPPLHQDDIMAAFGEKAFMLLTRDDELVGLAGWQVENLVTRIDELYLEADLPLKEATHLLLKEVEAASRELLSEAALLFLSPALAEHVGVWRELGYEPREIESLGVRAWQEAARESQPPETVLLFKRLRMDRIFQPV
jgi:dephospho-CoA kinase